MNRSTRKRILLVLTILCVCMIIGFTLQTGEESAEMSGGITDFIIRILCPHIDELEASHRAALEQNVHLFIRKLAHFTEYTILGLFLSGFMSYADRIKLRLPAALAIGLCVAGSDEFIQSFVPSRGPMITDVLIDFSGVCTGTAIVKLMTFIKRRKASCR